MKKSTNIIYYTIIGIISVIIFFLSLSSKRSTQFTCANIGLILTYILCIIGFISLILVAYKGMTNNPKAAKITLITVGGFLLLFIISYAIDPGEILPSYKGFIDTKTGSKLVGASLYVTYITFFASIGAIVWGAIKGLTK